MTATASDRANGKRPATRKAETTRNEILDAAALLFAEKGYSDCNLRELADRVGMKAGSFYYHFRSKEEILDELLSAAIDLVSEKVTRAMQDLGPDAPYLDRLTAAMRAHITPYIQGGDDETASLMRVWEHTPPSLRHRMRDKRREYGGIWYELIEEGIALGEIRDDLKPRILVPYLIGSMSRVQEWFNPRHMTIDEVCDLIIGMHLHGGLTGKTRPPA